MEEKRETITLVVGHGNASSMFYENDSLKYIRVFPACRYSDGGSYSLNPEELNQAVQMWVNKKHAPTKSESKPDPWVHRSAGMRCKTCMWYAPKQTDRSGTPLGRCRRHAPSMNGYPVCYEDDWCGDHKVDENKV